jgi:hypothetical protein
MSYLSEELEAVIKGLGINAIPLSKSEQKEVFTQLYRNFSCATRAESLWESLSSHVSVFHTDAWQWIGDYVTGKPTYLLIENKQATSYLFEDGTDIVNVLAKCSGFEFYLTDLPRSYLFCYNHHDYLIAAGDAILWLENKRLLSE